MMVDMTFQKEYWERSELDERRSPDHPAVAAYVLPKVELVRRHVPLAAETRLLDVGCGNGFFSSRFDKICDVTAVDYSEKMLALNPVPKKALMDAAELKFDDGSFDVVFCHALLHHVDNMEGVIGEMRRVSRRHVVILEPNRNNPLMFLFSLIVAEERKALRFSPSYLRRAAVRCGLDVKACFSSGMIVPNRTPTLLLPLLRRLNFKQPLGLTNFVIAEKGSP
jgi:SAM-dependent methyltransferase